MSGETPTIYLPSTVQFKLGFKHGRVWRTQVASSPGGYRQARQMWLKPKRQAQLTILGYNNDDFTTIRDFLSLVQGQFVPFFLFNPKIQDFTQEPKPGLIWSSFPLTLPFLGGTVSQIYLNGSVYRTAGQFTTDDGGTGDEVRITAVDNPQPSTNDLIQVDIAGTRERVPVISTKDVDDFEFDWNAADPPTETILDVIEAF